MLVEETFKVWVVIDISDKNNVFCMTSQRRAEDCLNNQFHMYFIRPMEIKCRYETTEGFDKYGLIEYDVLSNEHFPSKFVYYSEGINLLHRRHKHNGVEDENFVICVEYSNRPDYEPQLWFSSVIESYLKELKLV